MQNLLEDYVILLLRITVKAKPALTLHNSHREITQHTLNLPFESRVCMARRSDANPI